MKSIIVDYHEATKHHTHQFARSLGYLDWKTQPNPWRTYEGALQIPLNRFPEVEARPYSALFGEPALPPRDIDPASLSEFFRYSVGLSAWKQYGESRWALRVDPSSGNLHPTEVYGVLGSGVDQTDGPGVFHYVSEKHVLEQRGRLPKAAWDRLTPDSQGESFLAGVTSIHWREAWKYGERAYRYCQHDAGHVLAALRFSAALLGWKMRVIETWSDDSISALLGLGREDSGEPAEREVPDFIARVSRHTLGPEPSLDEKSLVAELDGARWTGRANVLSPGHVGWPIIEHVHQAAKRPGGVRMDTPPVSRATPSADPHPSSAAAHEIILKRRSALGYDPSGTLDLKDFLQMMLRSLPGPEAPWDALYWPPSIHFALFVHQVRGLHPGLYMLVRNPAGRGSLESATSPEFQWTRPSEVPESLPLYLLKPGDYRGSAEAVSCHQEIAGQSHFSLGMIAEFSEPLQKWGAWFYRNLFWEAGTAGQVLYLEAEAVGARATGIGCYFDDAVHELLGLKGNVFQSMYHFTVGSHVEDRRLTTLPPYPPEEHPFSH